MYDEILKIVTPAKEYTKETAGQAELVLGPIYELTLKHSLISVSKWESKWHKPFLDKRHELTDEEFLDYIRCMSLTSFPEEAIQNLSFANRLDIKKYIEDPQTATWFNNHNSPPPSEKIITNEIIYSQMIQLGIPLDPCQKWHLNHLLTLIRVCAENEMPQKKMSPLEVMAQNKSLNKMRKAALGIKN